jgi:hypothetical protein
MPPHPEDTTPEYKFLQSHLEYTREAFRTAEALLQESATRLGIVEEEARQHMLSFTPMVADGVLSRYFQIATMFQQVKPRELDETIEYHATLLAQIKKFNADIRKESE